MIKKIALGLSVLLIALPGCLPDTYQQPEIQRKTVFTILFGQSYSDPGLEDMLTDKIYAEFPDISLVWENVDWGEYFAQEMQAKLAAGEVPDMIIGKAQDVSTYQMSGYLGSFDESFFRDIKPETLQSVMVDEKIYGLPYNVFYQGVLYNKNIFWRYGLNPPETLEEMDSIIKRLNDVEVTPFATHFRENWFIGNVTMQFAANQVFLNNPSWGDEFRAGINSFSISDEYSACFLQVETLLENTWPDALTVNQAECSKRFAGQDAAMYITGTWALQTVATVNPGLDIGIFPYPNAEGNAKLLFEPNLTFMKNARSPNSALADEIIKSIFRDRELSRMICTFTNTMPTFIDAETDSLRQIEYDLKKYTDNSRTLDVTIGNRQIVWTFQDAVAREIFNWLIGKISFNDVLAFANSNRRNSGRGF
jgi:ABC-type glycerol-3-phosphate transport system substrate-binding protein